MKLNFLILITLIFISLIPGGVQAFTVESVDITIGGAGDADVTMNYQLNPVETGVYYLATTLMDAKSVAKDRLEKTFHKTVSVDLVSPEVTQFKVYEFADVVNNSYISPAFEYMSAENLFDANLKWIKDALSLDFTPKETTVKFVDGYSETFADMDKIPVVEHTVE